MMFWRRRKAPAVTVPLPAVVDPEPIVLCKNCQKTYDLDPLFRSFIDQRTVRCGDPINVCSPCRKSTLNDPYLLDGDHLVCVVEAIRAALTNAGITV